MGPVAAAALLCGAVLVVLGFGATALLWMRRRRRRPYGAIAVIVGSLTLAVLAAEESVPRVLAHGRVQAACLDGAVRTSVAASPVTWQMLTGGLEVEAELGARQVTKLVDDRLRPLSLQHTTVRLVQDQIKIEAAISTALGEIPVTATVAPQIDDGTLSFEPTSLEVAGRTLPAGALDRLGGLGGGQVDRSCGSDASVWPPGARVTGASIDAGGLTLRLRVT